MAETTPTPISESHSIADTIPTPINEDLSTAGNAPTPTGEGPTIAENFTPTGESPSTAEESETLIQPLGVSELQIAWTRFTENEQNLGRAERLRQFRNALSGTQIGAMVDQIIRYANSDDFRTLLMNTAKGIVTSGWTVATSLINLLLGLTGVIIVLIYLWFLLLDYPTYANGWREFLPPKYREPIVLFFGEFETVLRSYFRCQAVVAMIVGVLFAVGFSLIGLPMAIPLGLFVGLLNMVPYLQAVAIVPVCLLAALRCLETGNGLLASLGWVLFVFGLVQLLQEAVIMPRIMGKATGIRPVFILLGIFVWGKLLGFLGLLLAIPLTCLGTAYYRRYVLRQSEEKTKIDPN
jgi:predicted PurR-regulated permease PerM